MAVKYTYSISGDTLNSKVASDRLTEEIQESVIITALDYIETNADVLDIWFKVAISAGDETVLDGLVAAHDGEPLEDVGNVRLVDQDLASIAQVDEQGRFKVVMDMEAAPHTISGTQHTGQLADSQIPSYITRDSELAIHTGDATIHFTEASIDKYTQAEVDSLIASASGTTDHSALNNLDYASSGHTGFASTVHNHTESDITDLDKYTQSEVDTISGSLQTNIDGKSDLGHQHTESDITDLDKYTQAEVDSLITSVSGSIITDHGELLGLLDDDHTQYLRVDGTRALTGTWSYGSASISGTGNFYGNGATLSGIAYIDGDDVYYYDTTRSKDLGVAVIEIGCGRNSNNTTNQYLRTFNGVPMNLTGIALPFNATLVGMSMSENLNNQTWTAQVGRNGVATVMDSLTITNAYENHAWDKDTDFNAGDRVQVYCSGTSIDYPQVSLFFRRRK